MKIALRDLNPSLTLNLTGQEPWLLRLYQDFPPPGSHVGGAPTLTGSLSLRKEEGGSVKVSGNLSYAPYLPCSRCDQAIAWPLTMTVDVRYFPEDTNPAPREKNLSQADLDAYYLEGDQVDVEALVNDTVQTTLPSQVLAVDPASETCRICRDDLSSEQVFGKPEKNEDASPFAALKGLKLRH